MSSILCRRFLKAPTEVFFVVLRAGRERRVFFSFFLLFAFFLMAHDVLCFGVLRLLMMSFNGD